MLRSLSPTYFAAAATASLLVFYMGLQEVQAEAAAGSSDVSAAVPDTASDIAAALAGLEQDKETAFAANDFARLPELQAEISRLRKQAEIGAAVAELNAKKEAAFAADDYALLPGIQAEIDALVAATPADVVHKVRGGYDTTYRIVKRGTGTKLVVQHDLVTV